MKKILPKKLSTEARAWAKKIRAAYEIDDDAGALLLQTAMEALDRLREAQAIIAAEGILLTDRFSQKKLNPAVLVEQGARTALMHALKGMNLDIEAASPLLIRD